MLWNQVKKQTGFALTWLPAAGMSGAHIGDFARGLCIEPTLPKQVDVIIMETTGLSDATGMEQVSGMLGAVASDYTCYTVACMIRSQGRLGGRCQVLQRWLG